MNDPRDTDEEYNSVKHFVKPLGKQFTSEDEKLGQLLMGVIIAIDAKDFWQAGANQPHPYTILAFRSLKALFEAHAANDPLGETALNTIKRNIDTWRKNMTNDELEKLAAHNEEIIKYMGWLNSAISYVIMALKGICEDLMQNEHDCDATRHAEVITSILCFWEKFATRDVGECVTPLLSIESFEPSATDFNFIIEKNKTKKIAWRLFV